MCMALVVVILAAGKGSRMKSSIPKVLHKLAGKCLLEHLLDKVRILNPVRTVVVYNQDVLKDAVNDKQIIWIKQIEQKGTGDAVKCVFSVLGDLEDNDQVLVLYGDTPLVFVETLRKLLSLSGKLKILGGYLDEPFGYGRLIFDQSSNFLKIVEEKEASISEKQIKRVNSGIMAIEYRWLVRNLPKLVCHSNNEYYLTDLAALAVQDGIDVRVCLAENSFEIRGINNLLQLSEAERWYQKRIANQLMMDGLRISDPDRFDLRGTVNFDQDVVIGANVLLEGTVKLGKGTIVGHGCCLKDVVLGERVVVSAYSVLEGAVVEDDCIIGPFARLRAGSYLHENSRVGNFVELKKCKLGNNSKVNHLTYLGDAEIGKNVNIGAGTITCNYDGYGKFTTKVGDNSFIGSNVSLVAPLILEDEVTVGAGSVVTRLVPKGNLALGRGRQVNLKRTKYEKK